MAKAKSRPTIENALSDPDATVRSAAAASLGFYRDDAATERLTALLRSEPRRDVRIAVLLGLRRHGGPAALAALLRAAETDDDPEVRQAALASLAVRTGLTLRTIPKPDTDAFANLLAMVRKAVVQPADAASGQRRGSP